MEILSVCTGKPYLQFVLLHLRFQRRDFVTHTVDAGYLAVVVQTRARARRELLEGAITQYRMWIICWLLESAGSGAWSWHDMKSPHSQITILTLYLTYNVLRLDSFILMLQFEISSDLICSFCIQKSYICISRGFHVSAACCFC